MSKVILLLGSNLGNRKEILSRAKKLIELAVGEISKNSSVYESEPWGFNSENLFLNQVIIIETNDQPQVVLEKIQNIEQELGRKRKSQFYQNRTIDIDILFYDEIIFESKNLTIPHPQLHLRQFTMIPLIEIAGGFIHPVFDERLDQLSLDLSDTNSVKLVKNSISSSSLA